MFVLYQISFNFQYEEYEAHINIFISNRQAIIGERRQLVARKENENNKEIYKIIDQIAALGVI